MTRALFFFTSFSINFCWIFCSFMEIIFCFHVPPFSRSEISVLFFVSDSFQVVFVAVVFPFLFLKILCCIPPSENNWRRCRLLYREFVMPPNAHSFTVPSALTFSSPTVLFITHPAKRKLLFHFPPLSFLLKFHSFEMTLNFVFYMPPISKKEKTMSYSSARQTRTTSPNAISSYPRVRYFLTHTHTRKKEIFLFGSRNLLVLPLRER